MIGMKALLQLVFVAFAFWKASSEDEATPFVVSLDLDAYYAGNGGISTLGFRGGQNLRRSLQVVEDEPDDMKTVFGVYEYSAFTVDRRARTQLKGRCFEGVGLSNCVPQNLHGGLHRVKSMGYYSRMGERFNQKYCLQCCGKNDEDRHGNSMKYMRPGIKNGDVDVWDMDCEVSLVEKADFNNPVIAFGREFRLSTQKEGPGYEGEDDYIVCPVMRSACNYERVTQRSYEGDSSCPEKTSENPPTYITGYTMTIDVVEGYNLWTRWRQVKECEVIQVDESLTPVSGTEEDGFKFRETIIMFHEPVFMFNWIILLGTLILIIPIAYATLYFFREKHCIVCDKKLIWSKEKCVVCKYFKADPPDPYILAALQSKALAINGVEPPALPGLHKVIKPPTAVAPIPTAEELHFNSVKGAIEAELAAKAKLEAESGDTLIEHVTQSGVEKKPMLKGERNFHPTPTDPKEVKMRVKAIAKQQWKELPFDERLELEEMVKEIAARAHRLDELEERKREAAGGDLASIGASVEEETKDGMGSGGAGVAPVKKKPKLRFNKDGTIKPKPKWYQPGMHWFEGWFEPSQPRVNENLLKVHPSVIYEAVQHPHPPPRPAGMIPREEDENYGKPVPLVIKNHGKYRKVKKKPKIRMMSHEEWVAAGKPIFDQAKAEAEAEEAARLEEARRKGLAPKEPSGILDKLKAMLGSIMGGAAPAKA